MPDFTTEAHDTFFALYTWIRVIGRMTWPAGPKLWTRWTRFNNSLDLHLTRLKVFTLGLTVCPQPSQFMYYYLNMLVINNKQSHDENDCAWRFAAWSWPVSYKLRITLYWFYGGENDFGGFLVSADILEMWRRLFILVSLSPANSSSRERFNCTIQNWIKIGKHTDQYVG